MCGISGIILKEKSDFSLVEKIVAMSNTLSHRGPDGEGFMLAAEQGVPHYNALKRSYERLDLAYIPQSPVQNANPSSFMAFGHRRLSIIDLSETGHQPMCSANGDLWITYNGEIYNYIELREELKALGCVFMSGSDTEVILAAYRQWGRECVKKFNGMWAFCVYDQPRGICFASRDRLGVKPFYYVNDPKFFAFASEQKAFVRSGLLQARMNRAALHNYLVNGLIENSEANFFDGITELWPGHNLVYQIKTGKIETQLYYHLSDFVTMANDHLGEKELIARIATALENSVRIRLRSDVEVGSCLSGGIDSSALAGLINSINNKPLNCFTAVFKGEAFDEEKFADVVAQKIKANHFKTQPNFAEFYADADNLVYSQDVPIWSTSTYAQYRVMQLAHEHRIKVVLDGQGADELFGGYQHHFMAQWNSLLSKGNFFSALKEISAGNKSIPGSFSFYLKERIKQKHNFAEKDLSMLLKTDFVKSAAVKNPFVYFDDVNKQLLNDIYETRLKSFLKCEDRCGMWHSVESRTPFSDDIELISLLFSFNGNKKIRSGVSKYLLREAVREKLPGEIYKRYDKKGFETPMAEWMQKLRLQLISEVRAAGFDFVNEKNLEKADPSKTAHNSLLFKLFVLARWQRLFSS